jgi:hypothetical protein
VGVGVDLEHGAILALVGARMSATGIAALMDMH